MTGRNLSVTLWLLCAQPLTTSPITAQAADWPMLGRDGTRNPVSPDIGAPRWWQLADEESPRKLPAKNIRWQAPLGSHVRGGMVVANGLVWVGANNNTPRDANSKGPAARLLCFRERDGQFLYEHVTRIAHDQRGHELGYWGHTSVPLVQGKRIWFTTIAGEVVCLDIGPLQKGAGMPRILWKIDMVKELGVYPSDAPMGYGKNGSPAIYKDFLYVTTGNGTQDCEKVVAPQAPSLLCVRKDTGKIIWSDNSPGNDIIDGQWASPLVVDIEGQPQVIVPQGDGWVRSFEALTGKLLWQCNLNSPALKLEPNQLRNRNYGMAAPVFADGRVYVATGEQPALGGSRAGHWVYCLDPKRRGDISAELMTGVANPDSGVIWRFGGFDGKRRRFQGVLDSVAVASGLVVVGDQAGYVHALDAATGRRFWIHDVKAEIAAAPLIADGLIYVASEDGVDVFALAKDKHHLANIDMQQPVMVAPIFANGTLYLATRQALYAVRGQERPDADWPQWRGPKRDNISTDLGLRRDWPEQGPPLFWKAEGLGSTATSISLADGRIFALGFLPEGEHLFALDQATGKHMWKANLAPGFKFQSSMQWLNQRSPTIDGDRVFALSTPGVLHCVEAAAGKAIWRKDYRKEFEGRPGPWGFCDFPLVDEGRVICTPGGKDATVVALDKRNGDILWKCVVPGDSRSAHGAAVLADIAGTRMLIHQLDSGTVGISPKDGKLLWHHSRIVTRSGNVYTAIVRGNQVFFHCGWGTGWGLLTVERAGDRFEAKEIYYQKGNLDPWLGSSVLIGSEVHTACGKRIDWKTGALQEDLRLTRSTMVAADGRLIHRTSKNEIRLTEITEKGYVQKASFQPPRPGGSQPPWSYPIIAGGKLWLRDQDWLLCYDLMSPK